MNRVTLTTVIERDTGNKISIRFTREGQGDDIVDQWADQMLAVQNLAIESAREMQKPREATGS